MHNNSHESDTNDPQREHRSSALPDLHQEAHATNPAREHVVQDVTQSGQATPQSPSQIAQPKREDHYQEQTVTKESGRRPGEVSPELGQDSGSDWQESQQMGKTGHGGVQNPQKNA